VAARFSPGKPLILTEDYDDCLLANTELLPEKGHDQFHALFLRYSVVIQEVGVT
jgi:hypothetical protein